MVESITPFLSASGAPALLMALVSERMTFFQDVYGTVHLEDRLDMYGAALEPVRVDGEHFEAVTRCISNRVHGFTDALEGFLSSS